MTVVVAVIAAVIAVVAAVIAAVAAVVPLFYDKMKFEKRPLRSFSR